jgi:glutaconate CoA-transferase, subunit A
MRDKLVALSDAVARHVRDGATVFVGGFGQCIPFAIAHEIVRQRKSALTLCRSGADILFDLLIAAGCVRKAVFGYVGNPGIGLAHAFRRAVEAGSIEAEDWTNFAMILRLHAGALGIPFIPTATLAGGDIPKGVDVKAIECPYTREMLRAVPALNPDVAIVHAQRADREGNLQLVGLSGDTVDGALAADTIVATVERIVPRERVRAEPGSTVIPGFRVAALCEVPWGAYPSYVQGVYGRDDVAYGEWDAVSRKAESLAAWIDANVHAHADFAGYVASLDAQRLDALAAEQSSGGTAAEQGIGAS